MMKRRDFGTQLAAAGLAAGISHTDTSRDNPPFTNVFAQPAAYDKFMKTGSWTDKTILIAEMRESATEVSINKGGRVQTANVLAVEAEVKDTAKAGRCFSDLRMPRGLVNSFRNQLPVTVATKNMRPPITPLCSSTPR